MCLLYFLYFISIIFREVKTKINADYETTQTILKMKLDQRKSILKNKLIRLKEEKERGGMEELAATSGGGRMEFRKLKKSKEFRRKEGHIVQGEFEKRRTFESDEENDVIGMAKKRWVQVQFCFDLFLALFSIRSF